MSACPGHCPGNAGPRPPSYSPPALKDPGRGFDAVVIGEPQRAFYGNQYGLTFPLFVHYGGKMWVPEVGGPIDPDSEAHDLVMSVSGAVDEDESGYPDPFRCSYPDRDRQLLARRCSW